MEPITVTASIVLPLLVQCAEHVGEVAGKIADEALAKRLRALWRAVKAKFEPNREASDALAELEEHPGSTAARRAVDAHLADALGRDASFARRVTRLTEDVRRVEISNVSASDMGAVAFGGDVSISGTYAAGRDLTIPAADPGTRRREE